MGLGVWLPREAEEKEDIWLIVRYCVLSLIIVNRLYIFRHYAYSWKYMYIFMFVIIYMHCVKISLFYWAWHVSFIMQQLCFWISFFENHFREENRKICFVLINSPFFRENVSWSVMHLRLKIWRQEMLFHGQWQLKLEREGQYLDYFHNLWFKNNQSIFVCLSAWVSVCLHGICLCLSVS